MNDDPLIANAKALEEAAKTAGKAVDATREFGRFIARYTHGTIEQAMGIIEDKLRFVRWERQQRLMMRADEFLRRQGKSAITNSVPLKIAIPIFQAATIEEDDFLQDRWAALLAKAASSEKPFEITRSYVSILEQLSSLEVQILETIYSWPFQDIEPYGALTSELPHIAKPATRPGHLNEDGKSKPSGEIAIALDNLCRLRCLIPGRSPGFVHSGQILGQVYPTLLGAAFVAACRP